MSKKNENPPELKVGVVEPAESEEKVGTSPLSLHKRGPTIILSNEKVGSQLTFHFQYSQGLIKRRELTIYPTYSAYFISEAGYTIHRIQ